MEKEMTKEEAAKLVEGNNGGDNDTMYRDYENNTFMCFTYDCPIKSYKSLVSSKKK